jgi:uncharacterized protein YndB with AHSA1/START domain
MRNQLVARPGDKEPPMSDLIDYEPPRIERELLLPAPPEEVWKVVTGRDWLAADVQLELSPGGEASFVSEDGSKTGWVEEAVPPDTAEGVAGQLIFWWGVDGEAVSRVELTLEPEGDGITRLRLTEARPLEVLDAVGIPLPRTGGSSHGPAMLLVA